MKRIIIKRVYEKASNQDGYRMLVDRLWPRGVSKEDAKLDEWNKDIAPSAELRKWFDHREERFKEFITRYKKELHDKKDELKRLKKITDNHQLCLLYGAKDEKNNQAVVLKLVLDSL